MTQKVGSFDREEDGEFYPDCQDEEARPLDRWTVKQVRALAACTGVASITALRELEEIDRS